MSDAVKKENFLDNAKKFFKDVRGEAKKVVWPTYAQTANNTGIVVLAILIAGVFLAIVDVIFGGIITGVIKGNFGEAFKSMLKFQ